MTSTNCRLGADRSPALLKNLDHSKKKNQENYIEIFFHKHAEEKLLMFSQITMNLEVV